MELNSKDDLYSTLDEILARLSVIEQSNNEKTKEDKPKDEKPTDETKEVESVYLIASIILFIVAVILSLTL